MKELFRDRNFLKILLIILAAVSTYSFAPQWIRADIASLKTEDLFVNFLYKIRKPPAALNKIVILSIDEESMVALDQRWPWPRDLFAIALNRLKKLSPAAVAIDLAFIGGSVDAKVDEALAESLKGSGNVIIASHFDKEGRYILPSKSIRESALAFGFINKPRDRDLIVRRTRALMMSTADNVIDYSFALKTAAAYLGIPPEGISYDGPSRSIIVMPEKEEGYAIGLEAGEVLPLTYVAKEESFATVPFWKIIAEEVNAAAFKDKIVVIGITAELFHDIYHTPLGLMPGVLLNANEILMYVSKNFTKKAYPSVVLLIQLLLAVIIFVITYRAGLAKGFYALFVFLIIAFSVKLYLLFHNLYFDFFGIFFAGISSYIITYGYKSIGLLIDNAILRREATIDTLTGLYVYRYFEVKLRSEFKRAKEIGNKELSLIICDIDNFKSINDTHGHEGGNAVLRDLAKILNKFSRRGDAICRYGGEEFCFILPHATREGALEYAERSRRAIEEHDFITPKGEPLKVTASFGVALMEDDVPDSATLIKKADSALYNAKKAGKNKVIIFSKPAE